MNPIASARLEHGFSLIEMLLAVAITVTTAGILFHLAASGQRLARSQPEASDVQQRLRVAADMMERDLLMAGAGLAYGAPSGPLTDYLPAIVPARTGLRSPDAELSYFPDRISLLYVPQGQIHAPLWIDMPSADADVPINTAAPGCPAAGLCGFVPGTRSLIVETSSLGAGHDLFSVTATSAGLVHGAPNPPFSRRYTTAARVAPVVQQVYYLDRVNHRLMLYDGFQSDLPLVDNVVDLRFAYYADPSPLSVRRPPDGEGNCVYAAGSPPAPLLADLGGAALVLLTAASLTDGPICGMGRTRFDGDLLRIRRIQVTIRVQVAAADLRGSGPDFLRRGASINGESYVPDYEVTLDVAPRNMGPR